MEKYIVHIEEEYGYRDWVWSPDMTVDELKVWWESLPTVAPYFFEGPVSFPGEVHQICFHYEDGEELLTKPPSYSLVEEVEGRTVIPLHPNPLKMPEDIIRMHIHEDSDSYLIIDGVGYNHAGYVEYDDYNKTDENLATSLLKEHDAILSKIIKSYSGRIVKHMDNKIFAEFISATDAVRCSINIHSTLRKINSQNPGSFQMHVRVGIHMGEVYEKNKDLFGEGVNLAARIEPLAKYGGTVTTQAVYNSIRSEKDIFIRDMGRVLLKNIKEPERIFKIYNDKIEHSKESSSELTEKLIKKGVKLADKVKTDKEILSITVLYLKNLGSEDNEFFCYGLTEDLIIAISKLGEIKIPLINQILKLKDEDTDQLIKENKLKTNYIINGNIMKMGDSFRISLQFFNTKENSIIWTESWESTSDIVQGLINKIIYKMLDSIDVEIPQSLLDSLKNEKKISPEAYELFLKAKYAILNVKSSTDRELAQDLFKRAIKLEPNYLEARYNYAMTMVQSNQFDFQLNLYHFLQHKL